MRVLRQLIEHLNNAGRLGTHQLDQLRSMGLIEETPVPDPVALLELDIGHLDLRVRTFNALRREGVLTLGELIELPEPDLLSIPRMTRGSVEEVKFRLHPLGLSLRAAPNESPTDDAHDAWDAYGDVLLRHARRRARRQRQRTSRAKKSRWNAQPRTRRPARHQC